MPTTSPSGDVVGGVTGGVGVGVGVGVTIGVAGVSLLLEQPAKHEVKAIKIITISFFIKTDRYVLVNYSA